MVKNYKALAQKAIQNNAYALNAMKLFSVSDADLELRMNAYTNALGATAMLEDRALAEGDKRSVMKFAATGVGPGLTQANLRGTTIVPATIMSYVSSIAPIFGIERDMNTPSLDLQVIDMYSIVEGDLVLPNLGKDRSFSKNGIDTDFTKSINGTLDEFTSSSLQPMVARSLEFTYVKTNNEVIKGVDDGQGHILAPGGVLTADSKVNYKTGEFKLKFATAPTAGEKLLVRWVVDAPFKDEVDSLGGEVKYYHVDVEPVIVPITRNIVTDIAMQRQGTVDPNTIYSNIIQATYTKRINEMVVQAMMGVYSGDTYTVDLSGFNLANSFYDTFLRAFKSILIDGESILGQQTYKGAKITGILAGRKIANVFQYMGGNESWVPNNTLGYFKDLIGWYNQVPVVRWEGEELAEDEMVLTHKTADGQLAPVARGIFVTPTDLPEIASFLNNTKIKNGMFSLEGVRGTDTKLMVKIKVKLPQDQIFLKKA